MYTAYEKKEETVLRELTGTQGVQQYCYKNNIYRDEWTAWFNTNLLRRNSVVFWKGCESCDYWQFTAIFYNAVDWIDANRGLFNLNRSCAMQSVGPIVMMIIVVEFTI